MEIDDKRGRIVTKERERERVDGNPSARKYYSQFEVRCSLRGCVTIFTFFLSFQDITCCAKCMETTRTVMHVDLCAVSLMDFFHEKYDLAFGLDFKVGWKRDN